jgi:hypothetical protein
MDKTPPIHVDDKGDIRPPSEMCGKLRVPTEYGKVDVLPIKDGQRCACVMVGGSVGTRGFSLRETARCPRAEQ